VIRELRARHRGIATLLAVALPLSLVLAIRARQQVPTLARLPLGEHTDPDKGASIRSSALQIGELHLDVRTWADNRIAAHVLEVTPREQPASPDVLVYWCDAAPAQQLDDRCVLLGALAGVQRRRFALPQQAVGGFLVLYSLAHQELLGSAEFER
jgi:hypothetical protein